MEVVLAELELNNLLSFLVLAEADWTLFFSSDELLRNIGLAFRLEFLPFVFIEGRGGLGKVEPSSEQGSCTDHQPVVFESVAAEVLNHNGYR